MKWTNINYGRAICENPDIDFALAILENPILTSEWKIDLFTLNAMCIKVQKIINCKTNCSMGHFCGMKP